MPYFVSMIWLAMSALGCWPNASGWSTLGSMLMYSCKWKSLQLLERLFISTVGCYHVLIGFAFADHWPIATICSKNRASSRNLSQQTCYVFNQSEATLPCARFAALGGWLHVFPRLAVVGTKATVFALLFLIRIRFHSWEVGSTFEQCRSKIKLCYSWLCWW